MANVGNSPARISFTKVSPGLSVSISPNPIPAGTTAKMTYIVTADRSRWGRNTYFATPVVNGQPHKALSIKAFTKEDFSSWTAEEQENGAQPIFDASTYHSEKSAKALLSQQHSPTRIWVAAVFTSTNAMRKTRV